MSSITGTVAAWVPIDGLAYDATTNANDGFLQLTTAANSQTATVIFPDFDSGAVVQGFTFDCWVRVGNGSSTPADGFSISYARSPLPNPILFNSSTPGNSDAEEGTRTGIAVGFDAYDNGTTPPDPRGLDIWVDGVQVAQFPMPNLNGSVTDPTSLQTGPNDGTGNPDILGWAHCVVTLSTNGVLNVFYKDTQVLTNFASGFVPGPGQLVMAGRTGGLNENQDVDQITITTTVAQNVLPGTTTGIADGVSVTFYDSGSGVVDTTKPATVSIDGGAAVPAYAIAKNGTTTTVIYYGFPTPLVAGSVHTAVATVTDVFGRTVSSPSTQFTVGAFSSVNSAVAVTGVDTSKQGFLIKPWQSGQEPNNIWWADEQLAGLHGDINPLCDLTEATNNGYFNYTGVINFDYTNTVGVMNEDGNFTVNNGYENIQLPGLVTDPNTSGTPANTNVDNSSLEILCYLHFPNAGVYQMGVNSDDGFDVTVGANPQDWGSQTLGAFGLPANGYNAGRGASDTDFTFIIPAAGDYPFRLVWENGTGGANLEWFVVQPGGTRVLINDPDPTNTTGIVADSAGPALPADVSQLLPYPDTTTSVGDVLSARLTDRGTTVTSGTLALSFDGTAVSSPVISQSGGITTVAAPPGFLMPFGKHTAQLVYSTSGGGPFTNTWNFTISPYLLSSWAVTGVDTGKPGFRILPFQSYVWPNSYGAQNNSIRYTLEQLSGLHGINSADLSTATDGGYIDYAANVINFNLDPGLAAIGDFSANNGYPDMSFPGLLLTTAGGPVADIGDESMDIRVFIQFATAGIYTMGVNSDDGFAVYAGTNPADWSTAALLGQFNGGRGASDTTFSFLVVTPGIYPFRMIWQNGNGSFSGGNGANCEWFTVQPNGTKILINDPDPTNTTGVAAFYSGPALPAYISAILPADGATGVSPVRPAAGLSTSAFGVQLTDGSTTVTTGSIGVTINGTTMSPIVNKTGGITSVTLPGFLTPGTNVAQFVYSTSGGGPFTNTWSFVVASNTLPILNGAWAVTGVNTANKGFKYRPWQSGAQPNTVWWTEEQLAGLHGANNCDLSILNDGNYFDYTGLVNFDTGANADGDFTATRNGYTDINFPGMPGANGVTDNSSFEILTWLDLTQVGTYSMCVNSDDGFKVTVGPNPADWLSALNLGQFNAGRGSGFDGGTTFSFIVTNAGFYPFRLIWENGGGGCNCEWTMVQPDGTRILINDPAGPENPQATAYYSGPAPAAGVTKVEPIPGATDGLGSLVLTLADGGTPITQSSITLTINGVVVTPTIVHANGVTTVVYNGLAAGAQTAILSYSTATGGPFTTTWTFTETPSSTTPINGITLSTNLWTPPGSGSNPGFAIKVFQSPNTNIFNGWQNNTRMADMAIQGLYGPTVADLTDYTNNGAMWWSGVTDGGVINFSQNNTGAQTDNGNFRTTSYPDVAIPGLGVWDPTLIGGTQAKMDNDCMEVKAFLEFPSAGYYVMGVNSDDGFRVTEGDQGAPGVSPLAILAPAGMVGEVTAMYTTTADEGGNNGFGTTPSSTVPIIARVVVADPIDASTPLVNASALNGNIALIQRGTVAFTAKYDAARNAGAVAVIIANNLANDTNTTEFPGTMGGTDATNTIPALWVNYANGTNLIASATTAASSPLIARITAQDCSPILGKYDNGKGSSDILFGFTVPQAGVYPFRLIWENGGGDANCEWFIRDLAFGDYLVNEPASPVKAWITRDVHAAGALPAPKLNNPTVSNGNVIISWTGEGELWESYSLLGPWFKSTYQANPSVVVQNPIVQTRYFRVRQF